MLDVLQKGKGALAPIAVAAALVGVWWLAVVLSDTVIFPSPLDVVLGIVTLAREGTL